MSNEPEDLEDDISVTSSIVSEPRSEYEVDQIITETSDEEGKPLFLVRWEGYPDERCTWEPSECLKDETIKEWREEVSHGRAVSKSRAAEIIRKVNKYNRQKELRQKRRLQKRKKLVKASKAATGLDKDVGSKKRKKKKKKSKDGEDLGEVNELDDTNQVVEPSYANELNPSKEGRDDSEPSESNQENDSEFNLSTDRGESIGFNESTRMDESEMNDDEYNPPLFYDSYEEDDDDEDNIPLQALTQGRSRPRKRVRLSRSASAAITTTSNSPEPQQENDPDREPQKEKDPNPQKENDPNPEPIESIPPEENLEEDVAGRIEGQSSTNMDVDPPVNPEKSSLIGQKPLPSVWNTMKPAYKSSKTTQPLQLISERNKPPSISVDWVHEYGVAPSGNIHPKRKSTLPKSTTKSHGIPDKAALDLRPAEEWNGIPRYDLPSASVNTNIQRDVEMAEPQLEASTRDPEPRQRSSPVTRVSPIRSPPAEQNVVQAKQIVAPTGPSRKKDIKVHLFLRDREIGAMMIQGFDHLHWLTRKIIQAKPARKHALEIRFDFIFGLSDFQNFYRGRSFTTHEVGWVLGYGDTRTAQSIDETANILANGGKIAMWNHPDGEFTLLMCSADSKEWITIRQHKLIRFPEARLLIIATSCLPPPPPGTNNSLDTQTLVSAESQTHNFPIREHRTAEETVTLSAQPTNPMPDLTGTRQTPTDVSLQESQLRVNPASTKESEQPGLIQAQKQSIVQSKQHELAPTQAQSRVESKQPDLVQPQKQPKTDIKQPKPAQIGRKSQKVFHMIDPGQGSKIGSKHRADSTTVKAADPDIEMGGMASSKDEMKRYFKTQYDLTFDKLLVGVKNRSATALFFLKFDHKSQKEFKRWRRFLTENGIIPNQLYDNTTDKGWQIWHAMFKGMPDGNGFIIIHETKARDFSDMPGLAEILHSPKTLNLFTTNLSKPLSDKSQFHYLKPIFPTGGAIMISEATLLTYPEQSLSIIRWFVDQLSRKTTLWGIWKLFFRPNICQWLHSTSRSTSDKRIGGVYIQILLEVFKLLPPGRRPPYIELPPEIDNPEFRDLDGGYTELGEPINIVSPAFLSPYGLAAKEGDPASKIRDETTLVEFFAAKSIKFSSRMRKFYAITPLNEASWSKWTHIKIITPEQFIEENFIEGERVPMEDVQATSATSATPNPNPTSPGDPPG